MKTGTGDEDRQENLRLLMDNMNRHYAEGANDLGRAALDAVKRFMGVPAEEKVY